MIRKLNDQLYFHYDKDFTRFVSNEKLSIEKDYGKQIGTAQLMFSPYNAKAAALILTGAKSQGVFSLYTSEYREEYFYVQRMPLWSIRTIVAMIIVSKTCKQR